MLNNVDILCKVYCTRIANTTRTRTSTRTSTSTSTIIIVVVVIVAVAVAVAVTVTVAVAAVVAVVIVIAVASSSSASLSSSPPRNITTFLITIVIIYIIITIVATITAFSWCSCQYLGLPTVESSDMPAGIACLREKGFTPAVQLPKRHYQRVPETLLIYGNNINIIWIYYEYIYIYR